MARPNPHALFYLASCYSINYGFISHHHYMITMRSVCDNYVIQTTSMEHVQTRITSTASATTSHHVQFLPAQTAISAKSAQKYVV